jgi:hypothetical protein
MKQKLFFSLIALALNAGVFVSGSPKADVITFGELGAQTAGCSHSAGDPGLVCDSPQNFTAGNIAVSASGWARAPGTSSETGSDSVWRA